MKLVGTVPMGCGYLLADRKYCDKDNCEEAIHIGRLPRMRPPKNHAGHGLGVWANMIRWERDRPGSFYKKYDMRNLAENGFSSFQGRFRSYIHSVTPRMQARELALVSICRHHYIRDQKTGGP